MDKMLRPARLRTRPSHVTPADYRATTDWLLGRWFETADGTRLCVMMVDPQRDRLRLCASTSRKPIYLMKTALLAALDAGRLRQA